MRALYQRGGARYFSISSKMKYLSGMRFVRRRAALWMVSLAVLTAVGCGLSFGVDELTTSDAGPDTSPPDRPDGTLPDGALPDGALPDGAPIDDELIDDDASFPPSNIDAATGSFVLDAGTSLGAATEILALQPGALTVSSGDGGTIDIPPEHVRADSTCGCLVVSIKDWTIPSGTTVTITQDIPVIFVASGEVKIDGTLIAKVAAGTQTKNDGFAALGTGSGGGGGGSATPGAMGGPGATAANPRTDGGDPYVPGPRPWLGGKGGDSVGIDTTPLTCGRGGMGGGGLQIYARVLRVGPLGRITSSGFGAERGCTAPYGGGGGGAGGSVFVEGRLVRVAGQVLATGGGGAGAGSTMPGANGGVDGGAGSAPGTGGGAGGNGGDDAPPGDGGAGSRGGGGGGAAGGVFLRGLNVKTDAGTFVPAAKAP
jgi:hypothetical protein